MDRLKKQRRPIRKAINKTLAEVEKELSESPLNAPELKLLQEELSRLLEEVMDIDQLILNAMMDANATDEEYDAEHASIEEFKRKTRRVKLRIDSALLPASLPVSPHVSVCGSEASSVRKQRTYKLPKIELKKFNGDLKEWLGFWSQFLKIHEDDELHASDKFQYLVKAMVPGSEARDIVESYPQTADNYPKAISALKDRFGRESLLVQVYVRELLKLVINNVNSKEKLSLPKMYMKLESHLRALSTMNLATADPSTWLFPLVESSLPEEILRAWQRSPLSKVDGTKENPKKSCLDLLMEFLKSEVQGEQQISLACDGFQNLSVKKKRNPHIEYESKSSSDNIPTAHGLHSGQSQLCIFCDKDSHEGKDCFKAQSMPLEECRKIARDKKRCTSCLRHGHFYKSCKAPVKCLICQKKHLTLMCSERDGGKKKQEKSKPKEEPSSNLASGTDEVLSSNLNCTTDVYLQTLIVNVRSGSKVKKVRALIDNGSQRSYILKKTAEELNLTPKSALTVCHVKFGNTTETQDHQRYEIELSEVKDKFRYKLNVLDQYQICGRIPRAIKGEWTKELRDKNIWINDLGGGSPEIELLIGGDHYGRLMTGKVHQLKNGLTAVHTRFGWTILGETNKVSENAAMTVTSMLLTDTTIPEYWKLDTIGIRDPIEVKSKEESDEQVKNHFLKTVSRKKDGRYTVSLPWIDGTQEIPSNQSVVEKRLQSATTKLIKEDKCDEYGEIFNSWLEEGFIEPVNTNDNPLHFLPHRPVFKLESQTTPVRPVFDASCKSGRNPSLNDCLQKGPNLLDLIPSLLLRFREKRIGVTADIRKAFQMVEIKEEDRKYLNFLWWEDRNKRTLKMFRHARVVFGINCSPYLLGAVIEYHLSHLPSDESDIADKIRSSLYVDNLVTSVDTREEFEVLQSKATAIMADAKMDLRMWEHSGECNSDVSEIGIPIKSHTHVLGLDWDKVNDTLSIDLSKFRDDIYEETPVTKRTILSVISKVFDPIGVTCPALIPPKLILQEAWVVKLGWDKELPEDVKLKFGKWYKEIKSIAEIHIPRDAFNCPFNSGNGQIHCFCDASKDAYATVIFARVENEDSVTVQLLEAKARIAPIKRPTIPRMELLACTIGSRLTHSVKKSLKMDNIPTFYWTDSSTALAWIQHNDNWGTFVGNRVKEICHLSNPKDWRHVSGIFNPADLPSRGCSPCQLLQSKWWEGPDWLQQNSDDWPVEEIEVDKLAVRSELKKTEAIQLLSTTKESPWYVKGHSSYLRNIRVVAILQRFIKYLKKETIHTESITTEEFQLAELKVFRMVQEECFQDLGPVVANFHVKKDDNGLLRLTTKLLNREDSDLFKSPILLPHSHPLVTQLIRFEHETYGHAGTQFLMSKLRERVWILQCRRAIKKVLSKCVTCRRHTTKSVNVPLAPLPQDRVSQVKTFQVVGVDLAGPLFLKDGSKSWIVLYTCAVYRCIHLELVDSLSTESFLLSLVRFISRRGRPVTIYSDNGTNFVGANNLFKTLDWKKIQKEAQVQRINWKFNPPSAAWWGGWWERLVRSVKDILKRMLGKKRLDLISLLTMLCEAEAIINHRPLTYVTEDSRDLIPLTPAMFLNDISDAGLPEIQEVSGELLRGKYKSMRQLRIELNNRFRSEYLSQLVQRDKEKKIHEFRVGDIVLVGTDNKKRLEWPMARVLELLPGKDNQVRVARIKTSTGEFIRPLQRLYPLEVDSEPDITRLTEDLKTVPVINKPATSSVPEIITRFGRTVKKPIRLVDSDQ